MKANLREAVKNYKCSSYIDAMKEAIINSIQSNSTNIEISVIAEKDLENKDYYVSEIKIIDDGDGFNEKNIESFSTLYTDYKEKDGCKGVGRLSYLKLFKDVNIESYIKENDEYKKIELKFKTDFNTKDFKTNTPEEYKKINNEKNKTILNLSNLIKKEKYNKSDIIEKIKDHIMYYLITNNNLHIFINEEEIKKEENVLEKDFNVSNIKEKFTLYYKIEETKDSTYSTKDFVIIDNKSMETFDIFDINIGERKNYKMLFLLKSKFFDNNSDMMHKLNAKLEDKESEDKCDSLFDEILSKEELKKRLKEIKKQLIEELKSVIGKDKINDYNKKILNDIREKDEILHYINFIDFEKEKYFFLNDETAYKYAKGEYNKLEKSIIDNKVSEEDLKKYINTNLNAYIIYRQRIIEKLKEIFEKENEHTKEKVIHNLFIPQGTNTNTVDLANNNLWLLDDKFMTFDKVYSEQELQKILPIDYNEILKIKDEKDDVKSILNDINIENIRKRRPDIAIFKSKDNSKILDLVLLEFKHPEANDYKYIEGLYQLKVYAEYFARKFKIVNPFGFLLVNNLEKQHELRSAINKYSIIYNSNDKLIYQTTEDLNGTEYKNQKLEEIGKLNLQVISTDAMIENAFSRNKTFIDIIKNQDILKNVFRDYDNIKNE